MIAPSRPFLSRLLLRADGTARALTATLLFQGRSGLPRALVRRTLFKKSGAPRPSLPEDLRRAIQEARLRFWMDRVDAPSVAERAAMDRNRRDVLFIVEPGGAASPDLSRLAEACRALIGAGSIRIAVWPGGAGPGGPVADVELVPIDPAVPPERAIILMDGSLPTPQGAWRLDTALDGHVIAHGDEVEAPVSGRLGAHWFKPPAWSPVLASQGWLFDGAVAVDFRDSRAAEAWRAATSQGWRAALAGLAGQLSGAEVAHVARVCALCPSLARAPLPLVTPSLPATRPKAAVIIPTRDGWNLLGPCLDSLRTTDWPRDRWQIIVVDNGSRAPDCLAGLAAAEAEGLISVLRNDEPFNFSRLNNLAVRSCDAEVLVFLNNDTVARRDDWLRRLAAFALQEDVGAVGAKLLHANRSVQHGGLVLGMEGGAVNAFMDSAEAEGGYANLANLTREVAAVVGACLCIRRAAFEEVGGFNETLAVGYNDIVLCMDLLAAGYRNIFVAEPLFFHFEGATRGRDTTPEKAARLAREHEQTARLHPRLFCNDPYYSPRLSRRVLYMLPGTRQEMPRAPAASGR